MVLSKTAYVILGMLRNGPKAGYDIKQAVDHSTRFFWAASYGQIYPELKQLEEAGLIAGAPHPTGGRQRQVYELLPAGEAELHGWLTRPGELHFELRHEGILRFFFADALSADDKVRLVRNLRAKHERVRAELEAIRPLAATKGEDSTTLLTLDFGIAYQDFVNEHFERLERRFADDHGS